jgi:hypothetical protein
MQCGIANDGIEDVLIGATSGGERDCARVEW